MRQLLTRSGRRPALAILAAALWLSACTPGALPALGRTSSSGAAAAGTNTASAGGATTQTLGTPFSEVTKVNPGPLPGDLLIADRYNNRLLIVSPAKKILWQYRLPASLDGGEGRRGPDDAFLTPDGTSVITNEEDNHTIVEVSLATRQIVWTYGHPGTPGRAAGYLNTPDDAYRLPNGDTTVADIGNCRILTIAPDGRVVRQYGRTGVCRHDPPFTYSSPNGDTPLPDGGMLVTEIGGSHVVRLDAEGRVVWDLHLPIHYPSDAQLTKDGNILVVSYTNPGTILKVSPQGEVLWKYAPSSGEGRLNKPSLAKELPNGDIAVNDDANHRVVIIDPTTDRIVWQFGVTGVPGDDDTHLNTPDGLDFVPFRIGDALDKNGQP
ncbi:MAG: PQQ-binding-like beta-propeller repeat protein [Firmicutes bacterium]|nr:PQQ-binding-like beta-propeller repeat protein [Bacillota bacterium]